MAPPRTCECGTCRKCKHRDYMNQYYRRNAQKIRASANTSRLGRITRVREYDRERGYREYDDLKASARRAVNHAVANGMLEKQPCEVCGADRVDAHHDDYGRALDVRWLCRTHHMELHRRVSA